MRTLSFIVTACVVLAACRAGASEEPAVPKRPAAQRAPQATPPSELPQVDASLPAELRTRVIADAARRAGTSAANVTVQSAQALNWPDGSLGCPQAGVMYTQAIVPGYRVLVVAGERRFDYRIPHGISRGIPRGDGLPEGELQVCEASFHGELIEPPVPKKPPER